MVTKKIRTEYMKKFRDPKWETFSKCYEDSLKYRLTRRVMEHSHKPWFWEGWDNGSDSSGWSTPKLIKNKVVPLSLPPTTPLERKQTLSSPDPKPPSENREPKVGVNEVTAVEAEPISENGMKEASGGSVTAAVNGKGPSDETDTDNGPADTPTPDGESVNPPPKLRHRRRTPRSEPGHQDSSHDEKPPVIRKPPRAKSQPPISTKENRRTSSRLDWSETRTEIKKPIDRNTSDACVQTQRGSGKRASNLDRRRARSADLEKTVRSQLMVVDDRWMTEYMRCFSARLR